MKRLILLSLVSALFVSFKPDAKWLHCAHAEKYNYFHDTVAVYDVPNPIALCFHDYLFAFTANGERHVYFIGRRDKETSPNGYMQETLLCGRSETEVFGEFMVTIEYCSPAHVTINYVRFGGYAYSFFSNDLPTIKG